MLGFEVVDDLQTRDRRRVHGYARTHKTHSLEAAIDDDGFGLVKKNARMRLKRDCGRICSCTWSGSISKEGLRVTISN